MIGPPPLLVCLDLQRGFIEDGPLRAPCAGDTLLECARVLAHARRLQWRIVHCLLNRPDGALMVTGAHSLPAYGFRPLHNEAVIERSTLSAYGHPAFSACVEHAPARSALVASLSASLTFTATAFDAFERGHRLVIAGDAFAGQEGSQALAIEHQAVARDIAELLGFQGTRAPSALTTPNRQLEFLKGAGKA